MQIREATIADIPQMQRVRNSVRENVLSDPSLVTDEACADYITRRGKGWVCEVDEKIIGFAIADLEGHNIWALFLDPSFEEKGIGKALHHRMLSWYFAQTDHTVWLSTAPQSRAEGFYRKMGWTESGLYGKGEIRFEMSSKKWKESSPPANLTELK
jgi:GNAT superfamily N-acetyltransferase